MGMGIIVALALLAAWIGLNAKTSRPDGEIVKKVPAFRRILGVIMPARNDAVVYFDDFVDAEKLLAYLEEAEKRGLKVDVTHCVVAAAGLGLARVPRMNQFIAGGRLYKRKGRWITFSMLRKRMNTRAKLTAVKLQMFDQETFSELCERINGEVRVERSDAETYTDRELNFFNLFPQWVLSGAFWIFKKLNHFNLLPDSFIRSDAMFTSVFVANLGSLGMGAGYHHLYEWGTCPLFMMVGQIEDRPVVVQGQVVVRKILHLRYTYEERIDDGLNAKYGIEACREVLEDPFRHLGCLASDGSDAHVMLRRDTADRKAA